MTMKLLRERRRTVKEKIKIETNVICAIKLCDEIVDMFMKEEYK